LPEAHAHFEVLYPGHEFPIGFALCALGFTTILTIERLLFDPEAHALENQRKTSAAPVLAIALSAHALLAGFVVGSVGSVVAFYSLITALSVHKFAAAFTLGSSLLRGRVSASAFRTVIMAFALATPIGLILGSVFQRIVESDTGLLIEATFDALAAGTFLYIAALEVIHQEFFHKRAHWTDMLGFVGGLTIMLLLSFAE
jgi:zinc transporter 1/2/3